MKTKYSLLEPHAGWRAVGFQLGLQPPPADPLPALVPPAQPPCAGSAASSTTARPPCAGSAACASCSQPPLWAGAPGSSSWTCYSTAPLLHPQQPHAQSTSGKLSFSNNKEGWGSASKNVSCFGSRGVECTCCLTAGTRREGKAAGLSAREEMLWAVLEKLSPSTAAHCLSAVQHPLLPRHQMLLPLLAKMHVKYYEPATVRRT